MKSLAIITTHPIQYNAPWFRLLAEREKVSVKVFYTWGQLEKSEKFDPGFGKKVEWDIPLLEGYDYTFVENISANPGSHHYRGIDNPGLIEEIERWGADAVLVFGWRFKSHLKVLRHFHNRLPVYFRGDSTLLDEPGFSFLKKTAKSVLLKWAYRHVDKAFYVGKCNRAYFLNYGFREDQLIFAPHAIDNERFGPAGQGTDYRKMNSIPATAFVFLFAGKMETKKDPLLLLKAFAELENCDAYLIMVGNGVLKKELKAFYHSLNKETRNRIIFLDFQNQSVMPSLYKAANVFVLPSQGPNESWGLAVNEAMASGCAVLVSDKCGCFPDLVEEGENGFIFSNKNKEEMLVKMKKLIAEKENIKKMGSASQQKIKGWAFGKICSAIENEISSLKE